MQAVGAEWSPSRLPVVAGVDGELRAVSGTVEDRQRGVGGLPATNAAESCGIVVRQLRPGVGERLLGSSAHFDESRQCTAAVERIVWSIAVRAAVWERETGYGTGIQRAYVNRSGRVSPCSRGMTGDSKAVAAE